MTERCEKLTKMISTTKTIDNRVASILLELHVSSYFVLSKLHTENGFHFVSKFIVAVCRTVGMSNITTAENHPQTRGQAERFNTNLIFRLQN